MSLNPWLKRNYCLFLGYKCLESSQEQERDSHHNMVLFACMRINASQRKREKKMKKNECHFFILFCLIKHISVLEILNVSSREEKKMIMSCPQILEMKEIKTHRSNIT